MPDGAPAGPFEKWSTADKLDWLAESIDDHVAHETPPEPWVLAAWAAHLREIAAAAESLDTPPPVVPLCALRARGANPASCDRPDGHRGDHSWEAATLRSRLRDYEVQVSVDLPAMRRDLVALDVLNRKLRSELADWEAKPRWRARPKPDRG